MTESYGIGRMMAAADAQRALGEACWHMDWSAADDLMRECETELDSVRNELASAKGRIERLRHVRDEWCAACAELQGEVNELSAQLAEAMLGKVPPAECPLDSQGEPIFVGERVYGQDGKCFKVTATGPSYVFGRVDGSKNDKRLRPAWLTHEEPDSWERVERDACATERERDLVARCKRLAGVE